MNCNLKKMGLLCVSLIIKLGLLCLVSEAQTTEQLYAGTPIAIIVNPTNNSVTRGIAVDSAGFIYETNSTDKCVMVRSYSDQKLIDNPSFTYYQSTSKKFSTGLESGSDGVGFSDPWGIAVDSSGNIFVADAGNHLIRKVTKAGIVSTIAGTTGVPGSSDGVGKNARFSAPRGICVDALGNIYVADTGNHTIRKISSSGVVTTIAGLAGVSGADDGQGSNARFNSPRWLALDSNGKIYVADSIIYVRTVTPSGLVSSLGPKVTAISLIVNSKDELIVTNGTGIQKVTSSGDVTTLKIGQAYARPSSIGVDNSNVRPTSLQIANGGSTKTMIACDLNGSIFWSSREGGYDMIYEAIPYTPITITKAPSNQSAAEGSRAQFNVSASGSTPNYYWTGPRDYSSPDLSVLGSNIPDLDVLCVLQQYSYTDSTLTNSGQYGVCVYNIGSYANPTASLKVTIKPVSLKNFPEKQYFSVAQTVVLKAEATVSSTHANSSLSYVWSINGVEIAGSNSSTLTISSVKPSDAGDYSVVVTEKNAYGTTTASGNTTLLVSALLVPPQITFAPAPQFVTVGSSATFSVTVNGYPTPTYQWNFNGSPINGATSSSYSISSAQVSNIGLYSVTLTNSSGSLTSEEVPLTAVLADDGEWTVQSSPTKENLWGICYAAGIYAAVGDSGVIITSSDGIKWTQQISGTTVWLTSVAYGGGIFVAVGDKGVILTSSDGINWITRKSTGERINAVAYGNGVYLAVGETGDIWTSVDGITWAYRNAGSIGGTSTQLRGLIYVASKFYISGANGSLQWSYDGSISNKLYSGTTDFIECIAYGRNQLVATGANGLSTSSSNGFKWNAKTIDAGYRRGVVFWNNQFVAVDNSGSIATSFEGKGWITKATKSKQNLIAITGNDIGAVAVGFGGTIIYSPASKSAPIVQSQPSDLTEAVGGNIAFTVKASGSFPLSYQWYKDGVPISGAMTDKLLLANATKDSAGLYSCTVSNAAGSTSSSTAKAKIISTFPDATAIDTSFTVSPGLDKSPRTAAVQSDGKIIIGGDFVIFNQGVAQIGLARLNVDGSVDTTFKPGNVGNGAVTAISIQADGKILIGGTFSSIGGAASPYLTRLEIDGAKDVSFKPDSTVTAAPVLNILSAALAKIFISDGTTLLKKLNSDGTIDKSWAQQTNFVTGYYGQVGVSFSSCVQQSDGKIIGDGYYYNGRTSNYRILKRFNADGTNDASFLSPTGTYSTVTSLRVLNAGKILWASSGFVYKFLSSGAPDPNFNFTGTYSSYNTSSPSCISDSGNTWYVNKNYSGSSAITKINSDGDADLSWQAPTDNISFIIGLKDDFILAGGSFTQIGNIKRSYLARLNSQTNGGANLPEIQSLDPIYIQIRAGDTVTSNVSASGSPALNYSAVYSIFSGSYLSNTKTLSSTNGGFSLENVQSTGVIEFTAVSAGSPSTTRSTYIRVVPSAPVLTGLTVATQTSGSSNLVLSAAASGSDPRTYQWFKDFNPISGATQSTLSIKGTDADAGQYQLVIRNTLGTVTSTVLPLNFSAPTITVQPNSITTAVGQSTTLSVSATGYPSPVYQWRKGGTNIAGATSANYTISNPSLNDAGSYSVVVSNGMGSLTSSSALLTVGEASIISNVSVRTSLALGQTLIVGAVVSGGSKDIMVRAAGPALNQFGLIGSEDPRLELYTTGITPLATNDDWPSTMSPVFASVGAFGFPAGSKDSALVQSINGSFTVQARSTSTGVILVEAYDLSTKPTPRLINISARNQVGTGSDILIAGFAITGTGTKRLLIRGVGPGLGQFGVTDFLLDPKLQVFDSTNTEVGSNDNWDPALTTISQSVGAFALPSLSKDAALVVNLKAGSTYTVWVSGSDGGTGNALIEVYELP